MENHEESADTKKEILTGLVVYLVLAACALASLVPVFFLVQ